MSATTVFNLSGTSRSIGIYTFPEGGPYLVPLGAVSDFDSVVLTQVGRDEWSQSAENWDALGHGIEFAIPVFSFCLGVWLFRRGLGIGNGGLGED